MSEQPDDVCTCGHTRSMHIPKCEVWVCPCQAFDVRHDPTPASEVDGGRGWDDSDDQGNPGGI